jgi:tellurite resistance protein TerC
MFSGVIYWLYTTDYIANPDQLKPATAAIKFITGYLIELSLSVDNIFVIAVIFSAFKIPKKYQHRVLFWGILGAIVFRGIMIYFGVLLINKFAWTTYIFGAFLIYTAMRMLFDNEDEKFEPKKSFIYKSLKKVVAVSNHIDKEHFFVQRRHITAATPLFVALVVIEVMDVVFALDSVPAILAITSDPFLVFSSNIFAILGLRSMYFFLANMLERFSYLEYSLIAILTFVGLKMLLHDFIELPEWVSLAFIAVSLLSGIVVSLKMNKEEIDKEDNEF